jgi:hypothetical protein
LTLKKIADVLGVRASTLVREQALERLMSGYGFLPVEVEPLVEEGEFVPRSLVAGKTYEESIGLTDLSEPGPEGDEG